MPQYYVSEKHIEDSKPFFTFVEFKKPMLGFGGEKKSIEQARMLDQRISASERELAEIQQRERKQGNPNERLNLRKLHQQVFAEGLSQHMRAKHEFLRDRPTIVAEVPEAVARNLEVGKVVRSKPALARVLFQGPHPIAVPQYGEMFKWSAIQMKEVPKVPAQPVKKAAVQPTGPKKKLPLLPPGQKKPSAIREPAKPYEPEKPPERTLPPHGLLAEEGMKETKPERQILRPKKTTTPLQPLKPRMPHHHK